MPENRTCSGQVIVFAVNPTHVISTWLPCWEGLHRLICISPSSLWSFHSPPHGLVFCPWKVALNSSLACTFHSKIMCLSSSPKILASYQHHGNHIVGKTMPIQPWFHPLFFEDSPALMSGFCTLELGSGLGYTTTSSTLPAHISCWHFISSLGASDRCIPPSGFTVHQVAQLLTNYHVCYKMSLPMAENTHASPTPVPSYLAWHIFGGLVQDHSGKDNNSWLASSSILASSSTL